MRILTDGFWSLENVNQHLFLADRYTLMASGQVELAGLEYDLRRSSDQPTDISLCNAFSVAWQLTPESRTSEIHTTRARDAWESVSEMASRSVDSKAELVATFMIVRTCRMKDNTDPIADQLRDLKGQLQAAVPITTEHWGSRVIALARIDLALGDDVAAEESVNILLSSLPPQPGHILGDCHLVLAQLGSADIEASRQELNRAVIAYGSYAGGIAEGHFGLACLAELFGDHDGMLIEFNRGADAYDAVGNPVALADYVSEVSYRLDRSGALDQADEWARRALKLHRTTGNWSAELHDLSRIAAFAHTKGTLSEVSELAQVAATRKTLLRRVAWAETERQRIASSTQYLDWIGIQSSSAIGNAWRAVSLVEARRADALALMMRVGISSPGLAGHLNRLATNISNLEKTYSITTRPPNGEPSALQRDLANLYGELGREIGYSAADAMATSFVDVQELSVGLPGNVNVLQFDLFDLVPGKNSKTRLGLVVTWLPPDGQDPIVLTHELSEVQATDIQILGSGSVPHVETQKDGEPWQSWLGRLLLPLPLRTILESNASNTESVIPLLLLSPSARLWRFPFSALRIGEVMLVELAAIALCSSLQTCLPMGEEAAVMLDARNWRRSPARQRALCHLRDVGGLEFERAALTSAFDVDDVDERELLSMLRQNHNYDIGVISSHGNSVSGLSQGLLLGSEKLTAAAILRMKMPEVLVMGACWSSSIPSDSAIEPLGLPTMALLRGAHAVIGGMYALPDGEGQPTARLLAALYDELSRQPAPFALRDAQLRLMSEFGPDEWRKWAGLSCLISLRQTEPVLIPTDTFHNSDSPGPSSEGEGARVRGVVKWFNSYKGYGFLTQAHGGAQIFVHYSSIQVLGGLTEGQQVEFEIEQGERGSSAANVTVVR
jgi:CspA family cold shock protein